jgi:hypothetical protein
MSRSILLQVTRDSIEEVFQAEHKIDQTGLLQEHPLLNERVAATVNLYTKNELIGSYTVASPTDKSLLENIITSAKKAAFEDSTTKTLTTAEYLHSKIELILHTPDGDISETDPAILKNNPNKNIEIY